MLAEALNNCSVLTRKSGRTGLSFQPDTGGSIPLTLQDETGPETFSHYAASEHTIGQSYFHLTHHTGMLLTTKDYYLYILSSPPSICLPVPLLFVFFFKPDKLNSSQLEKGHCFTENACRGRQRHRADEIRGEVRRGCLRTDINWRS